MSKDGGPAFPTQGLYDRERSVEGMSLRDYFAAQALNGMLSNGIGVCDSDEMEAITLDGFAEDAYRYADEMLKERDK